MARYIDVDKLCNAIIYLPAIQEGTFTDYFCNYVDNNIKRFIEETIKNQPTADVVEVVRCKDCKHYNKELMTCYNNEFPFHCESRPIMRETDYCSYGERRTENESRVDVSRKSKVEKREK